MESSTLRRRHTAKQASLSLNVPYTEPPKPARPPASLRRSWLVAPLLFVAALLVRVFQLASPAEVVFDEVHFGKFAAYYVTRRVRIPSHTVLFRRAPPPGQADCRLRRVARRL